MSKISVVMSVYNEPMEWLRLSIDSILSQTFSDFEFIIVSDNPSYTAGNSLLKEYSLKDSRIVLLFNEDNIGLTKSLNKCLAIAKGDYIARMDADDIADTKRFSIQIQFLESHPDIDVCHTNIIYINSVGEKTSVRFENEHQFETQRLCWENYIAHSSVIMRRRILQTRSPLYNEDYRSAQDYELWTYLDVKGFKFGYIQQPLLLYRVSEQQISQKNRGSQNGNFLKTRGRYVINKLKARGVIQKDTNNFGQILGCIKSNESEYQDKIELYYILYLTYFTLTKSFNLFGFRYLLDSNHLVGKMGLKKSLYVLLHPIFKRRWGIFILET